MPGLLGREKAKNKAPDAESYSDEVQKLPELPIIAYFMLAEAYFLLKKWDTAEAVARMGLEVEFDLDNFDAMERDEHYRQQLSELLEWIGITRLLNQAKEFMSQGKYDMALPLLDQAIANNSSNDANSVFSPNSLPLRTEPFPSSPSGFGYY